MDKGIWEKAVRENANEETMGSCNRREGGVCTEEGESISIVERGKRRGEGVHPGVAKKGIYLAVKVISNGANVLCRKERWKEANSAGLQVSQQVDN